MENADLKGEFLALFNLANDKESAKLGLALMFPAVAQIVDKIYVPRYQGAMSGRISNQIYAHYYFSRTRTKSSWSVEDLRRLSGDELDLAIEHTLSKLEGSPTDLRFSMLSTLLEYFEAEWKDTPDRIFAILICFSKEARRLVEAVPDDERVMFTTSPLELLERTTLRNLQALSPGMRIFIIDRLVSESMDLSLPCDLLRAILGDLRTEGAQPSRFSFDLGEHGEELRAQLLAKVENAARENRIFEMADAPSIIWFWWGNGNETSLRSFIRENVSTFERARILMRSMIRKVRSTEGDYESVNIRTWSKIADLTRLEDIARSNPSSDSTRFLEALRNGRENPI